jgi:hypothetical protein
MLIVKEEKLLWKLNGEGPDVAGLSFSPLC